MSVWNCLFSAHSTENGTIPVSSPHSLPPSFSAIGSPSNQQTSSQLHHPAPQQSLVDTRPMGAVSSTANSSSVISTSTSNPPPHLQQASTGSTPPPPVSSSNQLPSIASKAMRMLVSISVRICIPYSFRVIVDSSIFLILFCRRWSTQLIITSIIIQQ